MLSTTNPFGPIDLVTKAEALWQIGRAHVSSDLIRPSEPSVTHHICVFFKPHSSDVIYNKPVWADRPRDESGSALASAAGPNGRGIPLSITAGSNGIEGCYVPGQRTQDYRVHSAAKLFKAGTDIVFQVHYTPSG